MDIESLFHRALDIDPAERQHWLERECADDQRMLARARGLLENHEGAASFLEHAPEALAGTMLQDGAVSALSRPVLLRDDEGNEPAVKSGSSEITKSAEGSRYQIQGEIARGGMGAILKGRDTELGRDLAVKVLLDSHRDKPDVIHRFIEEAQIGGQLQHPGIAPVYDISQFSDQRPFFTMKLVKGKTLAALLEDRDSPADDRSRFLGIFEQVCQTMAYAHSRGVIHRDLKPANIMVGAFGEVQVMDWGLAKVLAAGGIADERKARDSQFAPSIIETVRSSNGETSAIEGSQTQMGSVMGTPAYMPPEQALGEVDQLSERSDVFALGAIACEILTGKPPYVAEDPIQVFRLASRCKLEDCETRLEESEADHELKTLVRDCLTAEPRERPRDAGVVADRMARYQENVETRLQKSELERAAQSVRLVEERKRRRASLAFATALITLIGLAGGGGVWMQTVRSQEAEQLAAANETVAEQQAQRADQEKEAKEEVQQLLYSASINLAQAELKNSNLTRAQELLDEQTPKAGEKDLRGFEWNYLKRLTMNKVETETISWADSLRKVCAASNLSFPDFIDDISHDRKMIASVISIGDDEETLYVWNTETGHEVYSRAVKELDPEFDVGDRDQYFRVALNHDGSQVALARENPYRQASCPRIVVIDVKSGEVVRRFDAFQGERYSIEIAFRPGSRNLFVVTSDRSRVVTRKVEFRLDSWNLDSGEKQYSVDLGTAHFMDPPRFSGDGSRFAVYYRASIRAFKADPGTLGQLKHPPGIHVYDANSGVLKQKLKTMPWRSNHAFAFNHDGSRIACCTNDWSLAWSDLDLDAETALVIWDVESGHRVCHRQTGIIEAIPRFNPDGSIVALSSTTGSNIRIEVYEAELATLLMNAEHTSKGVVRFLQNDQRLQVLDNQGVSKSWALPESSQPSAQDVGGAGPTVSSGDGQYYARLDESVNLETIRSRPLVQQQIRVYDRSHQIVCTADVTVPSGFGPRFLEFNSDNTRLYALDYPDGEESYEVVAIDISDPQNRTTVATFDAGEKINHLLASPKGSLLIAATETDESTDGKLERTLRIWNLDEGTDRRIELKADPGALQFSHDGQRVAVSHGSKNDGWCSFFDVQRGELAHEFQTDGLLTGLYFSHNGNRLAGLTDGAESVVLDSKTGKRLLTIPTTKSGAGYVAFSAADDRLFMLSLNASGRGFQVCDASTGKQILYIHHKGRRAWTHNRFIPETHELISCGFGGVPVVRDGSPIEDRE